MSYICPVCNGLSNLQTTCKKCMHTLDDYGRLDMIWGPYAPYREIDDVKLTNGYPDYENHQCIHLAVCPTCGNDQLVFVQENHVT